MRHRNPDSGFWTGRHVLITGHTGFKGTWLVALLDSLGARVHGASLEPPTRPSAFEICSAARLLQSDLRVDIRDRLSLDGMLDRLDPEIVFHLAAQSNVRASLTDPVGTLATNVVGTANIIDHFRLRDPNRRPRAIISITSDKCYANDGSGYPFRESDPLGGHDPYSASKAGAELVVEAMAHSFPDGRMRLASVRAGNVIGGGDFAPDRLVPDFVRARVSGEPLRLRHPNSTRPWQHVIEPLIGYLLLAEDLCGQGDRFARAWNFGPDPSGNETVECVVEMLGRLWSGGPAVIMAPEHSVEATLLMLDSSQARRLLNWFPRWGLETALSATVAWYREWHQGRPTLPVMREQIDTYLSAERQQGGRLP